MKRTLSPGQQRVADERAARERLSDERYTAFAAAALSGLLARAHYDDASYAAYAANEIAMAMMEAAGFETVDQIRGEP